MPGTTCPDEFPITDRMKEWAGEKGVKPQDLADQTERFLDHHRKVGSLFADWTAAWRTWMRNFLNPPWNRNNTTTNETPTPPSREDDDIPDFIKNAK
jgi:hypothetical protein